MRIMGIDESERSFFGQIMEVTLIEKLRENVPDTI